MTDRPAFTQTLIAPASAIIDQASGRPICVPAEVIAMFMG